MDVLYSICKYVVILICIKLWMQFNTYSIDSDILWLSQQSYFKYYIINILFTSINEGWINW